MRRSCELKAEIVGRDEREGNVRALLNLGHTFGHAIEAGLGFGAWLHGEAVAAGSLLAARLSSRMGLLSEADVARAQRPVQNGQSPHRKPRISECSAIGN